MDWVGLIVSLVSGAVGGNVAGALMPERSLGTGGNSLAGIVGGGLGAAILQGLGVLATHGAGGIDLGSILGEVVGAVWAEPSCSRSSASCEGQPRKRSAAASSRRAS